MLQIVPRQLLAPNINDRSHSHRRVVSASFVKLPQISSLTLPPTSSSTLKLAIMSVPYDRAYDLLSNSQNGHVSASQRIPAIARPFVSERAAKTLDIVSPSASYILYRMLM
jgi:hypothetical protein